MDGEVVSASTFLTPARILIPKLVAGRERWKAKAGKRKRLLKTAQVRMRDLEASRARWQTRAQDAEQLVREGPSEVETLRQELAAARVESDRLRDESKKK